MRKASFPSPGQGKEGNKQEASAIASCPPLPSSLFLLLFPFSLSLWTPQLAEDDEK
jgi:hypothetical protein